MERAVKRGTQKKRNKIMSWQLNKSYCIKFVLSINKLAVIKGRKKKVCLAMVKFCFSSWNIMVFGCTVVIAVIIPLVKN